MAKEFTTGTVSDVDIDQVTITVTKDTDGNPQVRVRSNITVTIANKLDPLDTHNITVPVNRTVQQLGVGAQVIAIRNAILAFVQTQI